MLEIDLSIFIFQVETVFSTFLALVTGYFVGLLSLLSKAISVFCSQQESGCAQCSLCVKYCSYGQQYNTQSYIIVTISTTYARVLQQYNTAEQSATHFNV